MLDRLDPHLHGGEAGLGQGVSQTEFLARPVPGLVQEAVAAHPRQRVADGLRTRLGQGLELLAREMAITQNPHVGGQGAAHPPPLGPARQQRVFSGQQVELAGGDQAIDRLPGAEHPERAHQACRLQRAKLLQALRRSQGLGSQQGSVQIGQAGGGDGGAELAADRRQRSRCVRLHRQAQGDEHQASIDRGEGGGHAFAHRRVQGADLEAADPALQGGIDQRDPVGGAAARGIRFEDQGDGRDHLTARTQWTIAHGLRLPLGQHQLVHKALGGRVGGEIHALALETLAPAQG